MRELESHIVAGDSANHQLRISVEDEPGQGGASHRYLVYGFHTGTNAARVGNPDTVMTVLFQNGPIKEFGVNGVTHEALLAILIDRLAAFQDGPFPSEFNAQALGALKNALAALKARTLERIVRGVEGTHEK